MPGPRPAKGIPFSTWLDAMAKNVTLRLLHTLFTVLARLIERRCPEALSL